METLVLDIGFTPVARVSWQRAVTLLWQGKVEVVEEYEDRTVRSVALELRVPAVIRFLHSLRGKRKDVRFSRENVYLRDRGRCQYCSTAVPRHDFTFDHVVPRALGGHTVWDNVVVSCTPCNRRKGRRTPVQAGMRLVQAPVRPTSLPDVVRLTFTWKRGMPEAWKLTSVAYWNAELVE